MIGSVLRELCANDWGIGVLGYWGIGVSGVGVLGWLRYYGVRMRIRIRVRVAY